MIVEGDIRVSACWLEQGGFFIWALQEAGQYQLRVPPEELSFRLFAWHEASFYGSFLERLEYEGKEGIYVSAGQALTWFAEQPQAKLLDWIWSEEIQQLIQIAPALKEVLAQGKWRPDFSKWLSGQRGWRLTGLPESTSTRKVLYLSQWVDGIINEMIEQHASVGQAWQGLQERFPLLQVGETQAALIDNEEEWLEAIGWQLDRTPFRVCLQLVEPQEDKQWQLHLVLQDVQDSRVLLPWEAPGRVGTSPTLQNLPEVWQAYHGKIDRAMQKWMTLIPWLTLAVGQSNPQLKQELTEEEAWVFLNEASLVLVNAGFTVFLPRWWEEIRRLKPKLKAQTRSMVGSRGESFLGVNHLVKFDWKLAVGDLELTEEEFYQMATTNRRLMQFRGQWVQVDPDYLQQVLKLVRRKKDLSLGEALKMYFLSNSPDVEQVGTDAEASNTNETRDPIEELRVEIELNQQLSGMVKKLTDTTTVPLEKNFPNFQGSLRGYQQAGSSWLLFLRRFGLGGCLADDMGLGKTIQWIAYLLKVKEKEKITIPALLICPTSVVGNWQKELSRFAPSLKVYLHYGNQRKREAEFITTTSEVDLVITTYNLSHLDEAELAQVEWDCICLDEAQNIKNAYTKQAGAVRRLRGRHRIALTGTPMENRLTELWSIIDFTNPGYLGSIGDFKRRFVNVIERKREAADIERVQRLVSPFLLRRVKNDPRIELDLPEKQERKEYFPLTVEQAGLYENVLQQMFERLEETSGMARRGLILSTLTRLKQICDHPALFLKEGAVGILRERSNKVDRLLEMLEEVRQKGDRCLIFTQFVGMGQILQRIIQQEMGEKVFFLHGGTSKNKRDEMIDNFQDASLSGPEACNIFILSLKAGGLGLNLTAANHVFHFDRWWNPAVENQATDRTYRIGQQRHVLVHKFISLGTLEERIDEMIEQKQSLNQQIVGGETWLTELSTNQLREIFALRKEWIGA